MQHTNAACRWMAKTIPNKVAIPFPPLKPAKTGNICPTIAIIPRDNWKLANWIESGL
ncbi:hypothetical protein D3C78_1632390 [compost metagenome]